MACYAIKCNQAESIKTFEKFRTQNNKNILRETEKTLDCLDVQESFKKLLFYDFKKAGSSETGFKLYGLYNPIELV